MEIIQDLLSEGSHTLNFSTEEQETMLKLLKQTVFEKGLIMEMSQYLDFFEENVQKNFHVILSLNKESQRFSEFSVKNPWIHSHFSYLYFDVNNADDLFSMSSSAMKLGADEDLSLRHEAISQLAVKVHRTAIEMNHTVSTSHLLDLIALFLERYKWKKSQIINKTSRLKARKISE